MSRGSRGQNLDNLASSIEGIQEHTHTYTKTHECRGMTAVRMYVCRFMVLDRFEVDILAVFYLEPD